MNRHTLQIFISVVIIIYFIFLYWSNAGFELLWYCFQAQPECCLIHSTLSTTFCSVLNAIPSSYEWASHEHPCTSITVPLVFYLISHCNYGFQVEGMRQAERVRYRERYRGDRSRDRTRGKQETRDCNELCHRLIFPLGFSPSGYVCAPAMPAFVLVVGLCWGNLVRQTPCCPALKEAHRQRYLATLDSVTTHEKAAMFTQIALAGIVTRPLCFLLLGIQHRAGLSPEFMMCFTLELTLVFRKCKWRGLPCMCRARLAPKETLRCS